MKFRIPSYYVQKSPLENYLRKSPTNFSKSFRFPENRQNVIERDCVTSAVKVLGKLLHVQTVLTAGCLTTSKPSSTPLKKCFKEMWKYFSRMYFHWRFWKSENYNFSCCGKRSKVEKSLEAKIVSCYIEFRTQKYTK